MADEHARLEDLIGRTQSLPAETALRDTHAPWRSSWQESEGDSACAHTCRVLFRSCLVVAVTLVWAPAQG